MTYGSLIVFACLIIGAYAFGWKSGSKDGWNEAIEIFENSTPEQPACWEVSNIPPYFRCVIPKPVPVPTEYYSEEL